MKIFIATDHAGFLLKEVLVAYIRDALSYEVEDLGAYTLEPSDDYPDLIRPCALKVANTPGSLGIVLGASGQGEAIAANRVPHVRAALYYGQAHAVGAIDAAGAPSLDGYDIIRLAREHNDANILALGARFLTEEDAKEATRIFIEATFTGDERHVRRIAKLA